MTQKIVLSSLLTILLVSSTCAFEVWKFWDTILDTVEEYFPQVLSLVFFILAAAINMFMWYIRVPLLLILATVRCNIFARIFLCWAQACC